MADGRELVGLVARRMTVDERMLAMGALFSLAKALEESALPKLKGRKRRELEAEIAQMRDLQATLEEASEIMIGAPEGVQPTPISSKAGRA